MYMHTACNVWHLHCFSPELCACVCVCLFCLLFSNKLLELLRLFPIFILFFPLRMKIVCASLSLSCAALCSPCPFLQGCHANLLYPVKILRTRNLRVRLFNYFWWESEESFGESPRSDNPSDSTDRVVTPPTRLPLKTHTVHSGSESNWR